MTNIKFKMIDLKLKANSQKTVRKQNILLKFSEKFGTFQKNKNVNVWVKYLLLNTALTKSLLYLNCNRVKVFFIVHCPIVHCTMLSGSQWGVLTSKVRNGIPLGTLPNKGNDEEKRSVSEIGQKRKREETHTIIEKEQIKNIYKEISQRRCGGR